MQFLQLFTLSCPKQTIEKMLDQHPVTLEFMCIWVTFPENLKVALVY